MSHIARNSPRLTGLCVAQSTRKPSAERRKTHGNAREAHNVGRSRDVTDEQTHKEAYHEFTDVGEGDPQMNERLCVWRKGQGLEGETERGERLEEIHKGMHGEKDD